MEGIVQKIEDYKQIIDEHLDKYIPVKYPESIYNSMRYSVLAPGKRIRPVIAIETCISLGGKIDEILPTACAIEMLHAQSLIHDDLPAMDNDDYRRGKLTNHKVYGEATAILAGDALLSYAPKLILEKTPKTVSAEKIVKLIREFCIGAGVDGIISGQVVDIESEQKEPEEKTLNFIHTYKTSKLFELAFNAGAIVAGVDEPTLKKISLLAQKVGLAFQYADDILDEISTLEELGKTPGKDIAVGKMTACALYGQDETKRRLNLLTSEACGILKEVGIDSQLLEYIILNISGRVK